MKRFQVWRSYKCIRSFDTLIEAQEYGMGLPVDSYVIIDSSNNKACSDGR